MYQYLPSNLTELKRIQQKEAGDVLLYRTHHVYNNVIKWWVLCVLDKDCIAPIMERVCHWKSNDHYKEYHNCHRFDQSAINVLLANFYKFDEELYYAKDRMVEIYRGGAAPEQGLDKCWCHEFKLNRIKLFGAWNCLWRHSFQRIIIFVTGSREKAACPMMCTTNSAITFENINSIVLWTPKYPDLSVYIWQLKHSWAPYYLRSSKSIFIFLIHMTICNIKFFWIKYNLDRSTTHPKNFWPPDHDSTFQVTETPAIITVIFSW